MPTVPTYTRQVTQAPLPAVRLDPTASRAAGGTPAPVDLSPVTHEIAQIRDEGIQRANQVAVSAADAALVRAKTARLWDPSTGAMTARGKDAIPASDAAQAGFRQDATTIEEGLANDTQKEAFRRRVDMHHADLGGQLGQHVATQIKQYDADTTDGHVGALLDAAVKSYADEPSVQRAIDDTRAIETDYWRRNGHGEGAGVDDFAKQHIADRISAIRAAVFEQYSNAGQDLTASAYFERYKADFTGKDLVVAGKIADAGSTRAKGQQLASSIVHGAATLTDAMAEVEKIDDPKVQDDAARRVRQHYADVAADLSHQRQQAFQQASSIIEASHGNIDKVPLKLRQLLSPEENIALTHRAEQITHPKEYGDSDAYFHLMNLASLSAESRQQFLQENLSAYKNLSTAQRTRLLTLQRELSMKAEGADQRHTQEQENEQRRQDHIAEAALRSAGKDAEADSLHAANVAKRDKMFHGDAADNVAAVPVAPAAPYNPLAGLLTTDQPTIHATRDMIEGAAKNPKYAAYLRRMGVALPKVLPVPTP